MGGFVDTFFVLLLFFREVFFDFFLDNGISFFFSLSNHKSSKYISLCTVLDNNMALKIDQSSNRSRLELTSSLMFLFPCASFFSSSLEGNQGISPEESFKDY